MEFKDFCVDLVIKLGGSAITDKNTLETLDEESLNNAAELIRDCCRKKLTCIVVHGAGSFGHHQAKEYKVNSGWTQHEGEQSKIENVKKGVRLTRKSVTKLGHHVVDCLLTKDVPAVGMPVFGGWQTSNGKIVKCDIGAVRDVLNNGFVPVLHGDCVLDDSKGCTILSGDTIIKKFSEEFTVDRVVFLASVKGVFSSPPELNRDASLIRRIGVYRRGTDTDKSVFDKQVIGDGNVGIEGIDAGGNLVMQNQSTDVTGGMTLKVETAVDIVGTSDGKTKVYICKIGTEYAEDVCLSGENTRDDSGTEFIFIHR